MAISYTVSYTFAPATTISSSQVNTNFSDNANTWTGLEAKTKSFSNLQVDATPSAATDVAIKSYVDELMAYRRPVLLYSSGTVVQIETALYGTSGQAQIVFPDGNMRKDSTTTRIYCNLAQVAATSGTAQSGVRTGSVTANTWYAFYAVKVTDNTSNFVVIADTVLPITNNFTTLNSNFGSNSWVYLGTVPYGDNASATTAVPNFTMGGNTVLFRNSPNANVASMPGLRIATTAGATTLTWTYAAGTALGSAQIPTNITQAICSVALAGVGSTAKVEDSGAANRFAFVSDATNGFTVPPFPMNPNLGLKVSNGTAASRATDIFINGYVDSVLGVGSNPLL